MSLRGFSAVLLCVAAVQAVAGETAVKVTIAFVGDPAGSAWLGAVQGLEEANLQGQFLGQTYELKAVAADGLAAVQATAVVADVDAATLAQIGQSLPGVAVLDVGLDDDALRAACAANVLHLQPSAAMKRDAVAQWQKKNPGAEVTAAAWHPDAVKYSAEQLNIRYAKTHGRPMDDHAWGGWAAVKMLSDTVARVQSADADKVLGFLRADLAFDGQKGADMSFRDSGQLRQPVWIVEGGKLVGEAPVKGVAASVEDLDSLGPITCKK
jgi:hypothetical protein